MLSVKIRSSILQNISIFHFYQWPDIAHSCFSTIKPHPIVVVSPSIADTLCCIPWDYFIKSWRKLFKTFLLHYECRIWNTPPPWPTFVKQHQSEKILTYKCISRKNLMLRVVWDSHMTHRDVYYDLMSV